LDLFFCGYFATKEKENRREKRERKFNRGFHRLSITMKNMKFMKKKYKAK